MPHPAANPAKAPSGHDRTLRVGAMWAAISLAAVVGSLWGMTIDRSGGVDTAAHNARALWPFWIASASCWLGLTMIWLALRRSPSANSSARAAAIVFGVAILARIVVLMTHHPALSDDVYRYVFDGRNLAHGFNPYLTDPAVRAAAINDGMSEHWVGERAILPLLAYPEVTSPYLPLSQFVFAALGKVCEWGLWTSPLVSARVFRGGFTVMEVAMMCVIWLVLRQRGRSPWWLALYAWHPLAIDGFAASGHQDIIGIALMVAALAIVSRTREQTQRLRRCAAWSATLAAAVMVKPIAGVAGLMALRRQPIRLWLTSVVVGSTVCIALALPLDWHPNTPAYQAWKGTADWMAEKVAHFGGAYEPVLCVVRHAMPNGPERRPGFNLDQEWLARKICMWTLAGGLLITFIVARDAWRATVAALLAITLCSTTCHPWYLLWGFAAFPLAGFTCGGWTIWVYALTISWGYAVFITGKGHALGVEWTVAPWVIAIAYIPVLIALVADGFASVCGAQAQPKAADL